MKRMCLIAALMMALIVASGCSGVWMNADYSARFDRFVALSDETLDRMERGLLSPEEQKQAVRVHNKAFHEFKNAKDGKTDAK